jgi:tetratricopeptide (TPR) repeat protein
MKKITTLLFLLTSGVWVSAETLTSGGDFLKIPVGGRNASMGEASVAAVNDIEAINVNPAALGHLRGLQAAYEHQIWFQNVNFDTLSVALPLKMLIPGKLLPGVAGLTVNYLYAPPIDIYDSWSEKIGTINFNAFQMRVGYSLEIFQSDVFRILAGGNMSFISKSMKADGIDTKGQTKPSVDLSAQAIIRHGSQDLRPIIGDSFTAGLVVRNIDFYSTGANENWPVLIKGGFAAKIYDLVLLDVDFAKDLSSPFYASLGAEYWLKNLVAFRVGGKLQKDASDLAFGVGFRYKLRDYTMFLDYALIPFLGNGMEPTHKIAFKIDISKLPEANEDLLYYKGVDYFVQGNYPQAIKMWERVLQKNPSHPEAKKRIDEARRVMQLNVEEQKVEQEMKNNRMLEPAAPTPDTVRKKK